jgi:hypothetical protein
MAFETPFLFGTGKPSAWNDRWLAMGGHYCEGVGCASSGQLPQNACHVIENTPNSFGVIIRPGWIYVKGDDQINQGFYACYNNANPWCRTRTVRRQPHPQRIDLLVCQFVDSEASVASSPPADEMTPVWVPGGALRYRQAGRVHGDRCPPGDWPAMPHTAILLAAVEVRTGDTTIAGDTRTTHGSAIRDLRRIYGPGIWGEDNHFYGWAWTRPAAWESRM